VKVPSIWIGAGVMDPRYGDRVELAMVDPRRNARRYYAMAVLEDPQLPLFAGEPPHPLLVVVHGRLEGRRMVRREGHATLHGAVARWCELLELRRRHGYEITGYTLHGTDFTVVPSAAP
jgi:hypothetical protein